MAASAPFPNLERVMSTSAQCLNRLKPLGFSWKDSGHLYDTLKAGLEPDSPRASSAEPIVLSSSSDSEDDIPLSVRMKRAKAKLTDDVSAGHPAKLGTGLRVNPKDTLETHASQHAKAQAGSHGLEETASEPEEELHATQQGTTSRKRGRAEGPNDEAEDINSPRAVPQSDRPPVSVQAQKKATSSSKAKQRQRSSRQRAHLEPVIDLEASPSEDTDFKTTPPSPCLKKVSLKQLRKTNPVLAKKVEERIEQSAQLASPPQRPTPRAQKTGSVNAGAKTKKAQGNAKRAKRVAPQTDGVRPNWEAAGQSFWSSLGVGSVKPEKGVAAARGTQNQKATKAKAGKKSEVTASVPDKQRAPGPQASRGGKKLASGVVEQRASQKPDPRSTQQRNGDAVSPFEASEQPANAEEGSKSEERFAQPSASESSSSEETSGSDRGPQEAVDGVAFDKNDRTAIEDEEWKARRIEIEKQAQEAQMLKKKKRAEADLKLRAEERVNEYRLAEAAKMTAISEKESLRSTYRDGLRLKLKGKKSLRDILTALGCQVDGVQPASVTKAYRKALLHFHPDRHVNSPMPAQIYAEEVFKIISEAAKS